MLKVATCPSCGGKRQVPQAYKGMEIAVPCKREWLPEYILPVLDKLKGLGVSINYSAIPEGSMPGEMEVVQ